MKITHEMIHRSFSIPIKLNAKGEPIVVKPKICRPYFHSLLNQIEELEKQVSALSKEVMTLKDLVEYSKVIDTITEAIDNLKGDKANEDQVN